MMTKYKELIGDAHVRLSLGLAETCIGVVIVIFGVFQLPTYVGARVVATHAVPSVASLSRCRYAGMWLQCTVGTCTTDECVEVGCNVANWYVIDVLQML